MRETISKDLRMMTFFLWFRSHHFADWDVWSFSFLLLYILVSLCRRAKTYIGKWKKTCKHVHSCVGCHRPPSPSLSPLNTVFELITFFFIWHQLRHFLFLFLQNFCWLPFLWLSFSYVQYLDGLVLILICLSWFLLLCGTTYSKSWW